MFAVAAYYESDGADALMLAASTSRSEPLVVLTRRLARSTRLPISVKSVSSSIDALRRLLDAGAVQVVLVEAALDDPDLIATAASEYGSAAVAFEVGAVRDAEAWRVIHSDSRHTEWEAVTWAQVVEAQGAGELILRSGAGGDGGPFDLELFAAVTSAVRMPVIARGHAKGPEDVFDVLMIGGAAGVVLENTSVRINIAALRSYLSQHGLTGAPTPWSRHSGRRTR